MHSVEPTWRTKPTSQAKSAWDELWVVWLLGKAGLSLGHLRCVFLLAWKIQNKRLACESQEPRMVMDLWILDLPSFQWYFSPQPKASVQAQVFFTVGRSKAWTEWQEEDLSKSYMVRHIPKHHTISQNENLNSKIPLKTIERTYMKTPRVPNYRSCWILCHLEFIYAFFFDNPRPSSEVEGLTIPTLRGALPSCVGDLRGRCFHSQQPKNGQKMVWNSLLLVLCLEPWCFWKMFFK